MAYVAEKKRLAYQCLRCYHRDGLTYVDAKYRVVDHILKKHVPLDEVPFYCSLCLFKCAKWEQLVSHEKTYPRHRQMLTTKGVVNCKDMYRASTRPFMVTDRDMVALSSEESALHWRQRKDPSDDPVQEAMKAANLLPSTPEPLMSPPPVTRVDAPVTTPGRGAQVASGLPQDGQFDTTLSSITLIDPANLGTSPLFTAQPLFVSPATHGTQQRSQPRTLTPRQRLTTSPGLVAAVSTSPAGAQLAKESARIRAADPPCSAMAESPTMIGPAAAVSAVASGDVQPGKMQANGPAPSTDQQFLHLQQLLTTALQSAAGNLLAASNSAPPLPTAVVPKEVCVGPSGDTDKSLTTEPPKGTASAEESGPKIHEKKPAEEENILKDLLPATELDYEDIRAPSPSPSVSSSSSSSSASSRASVAHDQDTLQKILQGVNDNKCMLEKQSAILQQFCRCILDMSHALRCTMKPKADVTTQTESEQPSAKRRREEREEPRRREDVRRVHRRVDNRHGGRDKRRSHWHRQ